MGVCAVVNTQNTKAGASPLHAQVPLAHLWPIAWEGLECREAALVDTGKAFCEQETHSMLLCPVKPTTNPAAEVWLHVLQWLHGHNSCTHSTSQVASTVHSGAWFGVEPSPSTHPNTCNLCSASPRWDRYLQTQTHTHKGKQAIHWPFRHPAGVKEVIHIQGGRKCMRIIPTCHKQFPVEHKSSVSAIQTLFPLMGMHHITTRGQTKGKWCTQHLALCMRPRQGAAQPSVHPLPSPTCSRCRPHQPHHAWCTHITEPTVTHRTST